MPPARQATTHMIDAEFACMGPIAFDVGKMVGNLLLAFFAADGLACAAEPRHAQRRWLLEARRPPVSLRRVATTACMLLKPSCAVVVCVKERLAGTQPLASSLPLMHGSRPQ